MATLLYRLGLGAARNRVKVVIAWLVIVIALGASAMTFKGSTTDEMNIPGQESTTALAIMNEKFGGGATHATAQVAIESAQLPVTDPAVIAQISQIGEELSALPGVVRVSNPLDPNAPMVSPDLQAALITVTYDATQAGMSPEERSALIDAIDAANTAGQANSAAPLTVAVSGTASAAQPGAPFGIAEVIGVIIALAVLAFTYGRLVAAGMNLIIAVVGVAVGALGITLATGFLELNSNTPTLALMLGLAVGIDYALFMFMRFRQELAAGHDPEQAAARANATAGSAVVTAGLTVVIALAGLSVAGIGFLTQMGIAAAGTVAVSVLVAITLVPAVLALMGTRLLSRRAARALAGASSASTASVDGATESTDGGATPKETSRGIFNRWIDGVLRHRIVASIAVIVGLGVIGIPALSMHTSLVQIAENGTTQATAEAIVTDHFGAGINGPLIVLVDGEGALDRATTIATEAATLDDVAHIGAVTPNADGTAATVIVIPQSAPETEQTAQLVADIRDAFQTADGPAVYVTGTTAVSVDVGNSLADALPIYLVLVVGLAFILLVMVFRSLLVPLAGVVGFLLSLFASLGATVAVFQWGWLSDALNITPAPLLSLLPLLVVGILFGLAMDYQIFIVSRIYEAHTHGESNEQAIKRGFHQAAPVVMAAGLIMVSVFAGFFPHGVNVIRSLALALALGILFDAFVVRMVLMPALISLFGDAAWKLPSWLRWLPALDVEGAKLHVADDTTSPDEPSAEDPKELAATH